MDDWVNKIRFGTLLHKIRRHIKVAFLLGKSVSWNWDGICQSWVQTSVSPGKYCKCIFITSDINWERAIISFPYLIQSMTNNFAAVSKGTMWVFAISWSWCFSQDAPLFADCHNLLKDFRHFNFLHYFTFHGLCGHIFRVDDFSGISFTCSRRIAAQSASPSWTPSGIFHLQLQWTSRHNSFN